MIASRSAAEESTMASVKSYRSIKLACPSTSSYTSSSSVSSASSACGEDHHFAMHQYCRRQARVPVFAGALTPTGTQHRPLKPISNNAQSIQSASGSAIWPRFEKLRPPPFYSDDEKNSEDEDAYYDSASSSESSDGSCSDSEFLHCYRSTRAFSDGTVRLSLTQSGSASVDGLSVDPEKVGERHIRDVKIIERLKIPFAYDEIAYSSNEHFRELKSTPGLSIDQVSLMFTQLMSSK